MAPPLTKGLKERTPSVPMQKYMAPNKRKLAKIVEKKDQDDEDLADAPEVLLGAGLDSDPLKLLEAKAGGERDTTWDVSLVTGAGMASYVLCGSLTLYFGKRMHNEELMALYKKEVPQVLYEAGMAAFGMTFILTCLTLLFERQTSKAQPAMLTAYNALVGLVLQVMFVFGTNPILRGGHATLRGVFPLRYVTWFHSTPAMLFLLSEVSGTARSNVGSHGINTSRTVLLTQLTIVSGFAASIIAEPYCYVLNGLNVLLAMPIMSDIFGMFMLVLRECTVDSVQYNTIWCTGAFTLLVGMIFPLQWLASFMDTFSLMHSEALWVLGDWISNALFSCALLHGIYVMQDARLEATKDELEVQNRENAAKAFKEIMDQKDRFLSATSHELRTPLNGIIGLSDIMLTGSCGPITDRQKKNIATIKTSGSRLLNLINSILDAASMREKRLVIKHQKVKLKKLVSDVVMLHGTLMHKGVKLVDRLPSDLPTITGDHERIVQIFHNLIGNASKFTHKGEIRLEARVTNGGEMVAISIEDTGIGIPEGKLTTIFGAFQQVDTKTTRQYGGTGLGLSLVKQLVEAHNGTIVCTSKLGKGTCFTFNLPVKQVLENGDLDSGTSMSAD